MSNDLDLSVFSNEYEIRQIFQRMMEVQLDKSIPKQEKMEKIADLFIEFQEITDCTRDELVEVIREIRNITPEEIADEILRQQQENQ